MDQLTSLSYIFTEKIFRIPDYQRGYSWTRKQVEDFWNDLKRLELNKNHYVGVLTLELVPKDQVKRWIDDTWIIESKKYTPYYVVDGQQRLTTAIVLIHSIIETMRKKNILKLNYTSPEEINKKFISESKNENDSKTYIFGYEPDNPSYDFLICKILNEKEHFSKTIEETTYTLNLTDTKKFFIDQLSKLQVSELEEIYTKITQHFLFNIYTISEDIDVFVTFETMNNRGKALSHLELLKNRMIYISTLFKNVESGKERLRRNINDCWKQIYHVLGKAKQGQLQDDEFLVTHFMLYFSEEINNLKEKNNFKFYNDFGVAQSEYLLNDYFVPINIVNGKLTMTKCFEYINSLNKCIFLWEFIKNTDSQKYSTEIKEYASKIKYLTFSRKSYYRYGRIIDDKYINVFILACFNDCNGDDILLLEFLKVFEKYLFVINFFDSEDLRGIGIKFINMKDLVRKLNKSESNIQMVIEKIKKVYSQIIASSELMSKTIQLYSKKGFYNFNGWLKYFLCEYESKLMKASKSGISKLNKEILFSCEYDSIEHIYPQNTKYPYWVGLYKKFDTEERNRLKKSLGNFVAISGPKNGKLGNLPFPKKKSNSENTVGYLYGTYAELELIKLEDWSANEILERGLKLTDFLNERWGIRVASTKKEKKRFLGLDFL